MMHSNLNIEIFRPLYCLDRTQCVPCSKVHWIQIIIDSVKQTIQISTEFLAQAMIPPSPIQAFNPVQAYGRGFAHAPRPIKYWFNYIISLTSPKGIQLTLPHLQKCTNEKRTLPLFKGMPSWNFRWLVESKFETDKDRPVSHIFDSTYRNMIWYRNFMSHGARCCAVTVIPRP